MSKFFKKIHPTRNKETKAPVIYRRIIISLLLAITIWSSVGFGVEKNMYSLNSNHSVTKVFAQMEEDDWRAVITTSSRDAGIITEEEAEEIEVEIKKENQPSFFGKWTAKIVGAVGGKIGQIVMMVNGILLQAIAIPIMSILFRISAAMLDMSIKFTLSTGIYKDTSSGVLIVWSMIRNICNITFIFILLWASIQTILGIADGKTKKIIVSVIVAALLINFSLFITRIVIDAGNILAVTLYNKIDPTGIGLDSVFMKNLGLSGITAAAKEASIDGVVSISFGIVSYLQLITLFIAFFVFMYAMLLMATRIVVLIFLAALSPIGFMGNVLPKMAEYSKQWRETLYGQVMIAPIFLLFVYLIMQVANEFQNIPTGTITSLHTADDLSKSSDYLAYFKYVMVIMLLIIAVKITKKMSGVVGGAVEKLGGMAIGAALGAATGGAALAMRQTIGRSSTNALEGEKGKALRDAADAGDKGAQRKLRALEFASKSSFDARNTKAGKLAGKGFDKVGGMVGLSVPSLGKGGGVYSKDGKQTGFAGARQAEDDRLIREARKKTSTDEERAAAEKVYEKRNAELASNTEHAGAKARKDALLDVSGHADFKTVDDEVKKAERALSAASASNADAARADLKKAEDARTKKQAELVAVARVANKDQIEAEEKIMKAEEDKWEKNASVEDKKTLNAANRRENFINTRAKNKEQASRVRKSAGKERDTGQEALDRMNDLEDLIRKQAGK